MISLPEQQRRSSDSTTIQFEIVGDAAQASKLSEDLKAGNIAGRLSSQLSQEYNTSIIATVMSAPPETFEAPAGDWLLQPDGSYKLAKCPQGFLLVNTTVELSRCKECDANSYSFSDSTGCVSNSNGEHVCNIRDCSACPAGAKCLKGSSEGWQHFIPEQVRVGDTYHPVATLKMIDGKVFRFFCDQQTLACAPLDMSLPAHAEATVSDDDSYVWEYVQACTVDTQPCSPQHAASVILRRCPAGTVLINSTQSRGFDPALQVRPKLKVWKCVCARA